MHNNSHKIRILFITSNLGIGGLERVIVQLCTHIDKQLFSPAVCCIHFKGDLAQGLEKQNIRIFNINSRKPDYLAFLKIIPIINEFKPQIIHTHNINASIDGIIASVIKRVPVKIHTDHARKFPDKHHYMLIERLISCFINRIIAVTEETKSNLIRYEKINEKKINVINNGIESLKLRSDYQNNEKKRELELSNYKFIIGTVARLESQKGLIHLIRATPKILQLFPDTAVIIAGKGSQRDRLQQEAKNLGIQDNIKFLGARLDVCDILSILDVYVLPSEWEGLPMALLEAMSCERPIVAANVGGISQAIIDGESGILVPPSSSLALSQAICMLLNNSRLRQMIARSARIRFEQNYTVTKMVQMHQDLYIKCLKKRYR